MATVCHPGSGRITASFGPVAVHYQVGISICPSRHAWRKGVVEKSAHTIAQRWWRTLPDEVTVAAAQASLDRLCVRLGRPQAGPRRDADHGRGAGRGRAAAGDAGAVPGGARGRAHGRQPGAGGLPRQPVLRPARARRRAGGGAAQARCGHPGLASRAGGGAGPPRPPPDGAGAVVRDEEHVTALDAGGAGRLLRPGACRPKTRRPPSAAARAEAERIRRARTGDTAAGEQVVIDFADLRRAPSPPLTRPGVAAQCGPTDEQRTSAPSAPSAPSEPMGTPFECRRRSSTSGCVRTWRLSGSPPPPRRCTAVLDTARDQGWSVIATLERLLAAEVAAAAARRHAGLLRIAALPGALHARRLRLHRPARSRRETDPRTRLRCASSTTPATCCSSARPAPARRCSRSAWPAPRSTPGTGSTSPPPPTWPNAAAAPPPRAAGQPPALLLRAETAGHRRVRLRPARPRPRSQRRPVRGDQPPLPEVLDHLPATPASPAGASGSPTRCWPPRCWTGCCTAGSWSPSTAPPTGCAPTSNAPKQLRRALTTSRHAMTGTVPCARCGTSMPAPTGRAARRRYCGDVLPQGRLARPAPRRRPRGRPTHRPQRRLRQRRPDPGPGRRSDTGQPAPLPTLPPTPGDHQRRHPRRRRRHLRPGAAHHTQLTR